jgi:hypothetical protein
MYIASALRRKRDEIAATIAAYEARIDAARMDLAALDQAARLFDPEAGCDETGFHLALRQVALPSPGPRAAPIKTPVCPNPLECGSAGSAGSLRRPSRRRGEDRYQENFFIWIGRNPLKSLDSKK